MNNNDPLESFLGTIKTLERPIHRVPLGDFAEAPLVLLWQEPDALRTAEAHITAALLAQPPSLLDASLAASVADFAALHVGAELEGANTPSGTRTVTNPAEFYKRIALDQRNPRLWHWLTGESRRLFPAYFNSQEQAIAGLIGVAREQGIDLKALAKEPERIQELTLVAKKKLAAGWLPPALDTSDAIPTESPRELPASS